ncbi:hypothetical protein D3C71_1668900 [compost metagenome]
MPVEVRGHIGIGVRHAAATKRSQQDMLHEVQPLCLPLHAAGQLVQVQRRRYHAAGAMPHR